MYSKKQLRTEVTQQYEFAYKSSSVIEDAEIRSEEDNIFFLLEYKKGGIGCVHYHRGGWAASKLIISVRQSGEDEMRGIRN